MFFAQAPLWLSSLIFLVVLPLVAVAAHAIARRRFGINSLRANNEVASAKFNTIGAAYAVLLAFAVTVVWEKFNAAESLVTQEASAAVTIYRLAKSLPDDTGSALHGTINTYLKAAIEQDWPAMAHGRDGRPSPEATHALDETYAVLLRYSPVDGRGEALLNGILHQLDQLTDARRGRIAAAGGSVPSVVWMVLVGGAFLTIGFTFFLGTENFNAQMLMTGALSVLIFSGLLLIVTVDHPFSGSVKVQPEALEFVLTHFGNVANPR